MGIFDDEEDQLNTMAPPSNMEQRPLSMPQEINDEADGLEEDMAAENEGEMLTAANNYPDVMPQEHGPIPGIQKPSKPHPYQSMFDEYKKLQGESSDKYRNLAIIDGLSQLGQSFAARHTPGFKPKSNMELYGKLANSDVENFENRLKNDPKAIELSDADKLRDPNSTVSQYYRLRAHQRGLPVTEEMSAWDIQGMLKLEGKPQAARPPAKANFRDNDTGKDVAGYYQDGKYFGTDGIEHKNVSPFQGAFFGMDAAGGGNISFDKATRTATPISLGTPSVNSTEKPTQPGQAAVEKRPSELYSEIARRAPKDAVLLQKEQDEYKKAAEVPLNVLNIADALDSRLDAAMKNPQEVPQIKAQLAYLAEKAPKSDEDFQRYVSEQGLFNKLTALLPKNFEGTLSQEQVDGLRNMLRSSKTAAMQIAKSRRDSAAKNTKLLTQGITPEQMGGLIFELPGDNEIARKMPDGRIVIFDKYTKQKIREEKR